MEGEPFLEPFRIGNPYYMLTTAQTFPFIAVQLSFGLL